jgi:hypothetical protein
VVRDYLRRKKALARERYWAKLNHFRAGNVNQAGQAPLFPNVKYIKSVTGGVLYNDPATSAFSFYHSFPTNAFNDPIGSPQVNQFNTSTSVHTVVDKNYDEYYTAGYRMSRVISAEYRIIVNCRQNSATKDIMVGWAWGREKMDGTIFTQNNTDEIRLMMSRGWTIRRLSGTESGGSIYPSTGQWTIKTGNIYKLYNALDKGHSETIDDTNSYDALAAEITATRVANIPVKCPYLYLVIIATGNTALVDDDVSVKVECHQKVKLMMPRTKTSVVDALVAHA